MVENHRVCFVPPSPPDSGPPTGEWRLATPLPCALGKQAPAGSQDICAQSPMGHGREPTVFWGITSARGRQLACGRAVTRP
jgi:hypothetical protein